MAVDFNKLLSVSADDVKAPKPLPAGTYHGVIKSYKFGESSQNKTPYVRFDIGIQSAGADIVPEDLEEIDLSKKKLYRDYYLTTEALYRLKELIQSCNIPMQGRQFSEMIPDLNGMPVIIDVTQRPNANDPAAPPFNDVAKLAGQP